jgi:hypothetical protein
MKLVYYVYRWFGRACARTTPWTPGMEYRPPVWSLDPRYGVSIVRHKLSLAPNPWARPPSVLRIHHPRRSSAVLAAVSPSSNTCAATVTAELESQSSLISALSGQCLTCNRPGSRSASPRSNHASAACRARAHTHKHTHTWAYARAGERQTCQRHVSAHISLTPSVAVHPKAS